MVEQRDGYHEKWDLEKDATITGFYEAYPQYKDYPVPEDRFSWTWYYGMQHMGDLAAKDTSTEMMEKIMMRNTVSEKVALFVPTMHAQLSFNNLACTDMVSHLEFLKALTEFHENLRLGFYSKIFDEKTADSVDWKNHEAKFYTQKRDFSWLQLMFPTLLITIIIGALGMIKIRKL
jgi:ABC-2 type transport system permease protein